MTSRRTHWTLAAGLLCAGLILFAVADPVGGGPTLTVDAAAGVYAGETVSGVAMDPDGEIVTVRMYIDGELVAEDDVMEDGQNEFEFDVPADAAGKIVTIEAVDGDGNVVQQSFRVRKPR